MSETNNVQSPSTISPTTGTWTGKQAYVLAAFCLLLGVALGYLFRGSASPAAAQAAPTATAQQGSGAHQQAPDPSVQAALMQASAPLIEAVNKDPNDFDSLVKLGNLFYDATGLVCGKILSSS